MTDTNLPPLPEPYAWHTEDHLTDRTATTYSKAVADRWECKGWAIVPMFTATQVEEIEQAEWLDLGMPETLWVNRVKEFGPLIISIDTQGNNLIEKNKAEFNAKKGPILEKIYSQVSFIK